MNFEKRNYIFQKKDGTSQKCFRITEKEFLNELIGKATNENIDYDGVLVEHVGWYGETDDLNFDPRLYVIVTGFDGEKYAISYRDFQRVDDIANYEGLTNKSFIETKVVPVSELGTDFVLARTRRIEDSLSPADPLNLYQDEPGFQNDTDESCDVYSINTKYLIGFKLIAAVKKLNDQGIYNIAISVNGALGEFLDSFYIKTFYVYSSKSKYVPRHALSFNLINEGLIMCDSEIAKVYEKHGFRLLTFTPSEGRSQVESQRKK